MKPKIFCIGEVLWDALPAGLFLGGAPFNVACHLQMLGADVEMASRIGDDRLGKLAVKRIRERGIDTRFIQKDNTFETGIVDVTLTAADNPKYDILKNVAWDFISLDGPLLDEVGDIDVLVYGSLCQRSEQSRGTIEQVRKNCSLNIFDVNLRHPFDDAEVVRRSLQDAHIVKLNDDELLQIADWFGLPITHKRGMIALADKFQCETVCVTSGANGAIALHNDQWHEQNGLTVDVCDTVGSGDAFLAGFIAKLMAGSPMTEVLSFANACGAFVATKQGATPKLDLGEINRY